MMSDLNKLTIAEARDALKKGDVTSVELTEACIGAIDAAGALNAFVHKTPEIAMEQARRADARIAGGDAPDMCGIPLGIKDLFCTEGVRSTACSKILNDFKPSYESTVTANLAVALKRAGVKVGVIDADIYGPSQPILLKSEDLKPEAEGETLQPVRGVADIPMLSMGHLVAKGRALAWRGPMAGRALAQLFEANWGDTELLLVDLPPGTGDVQITMLQKFRPDGAVIVSTPQDLALADAARAGSLFDQGEVPILGLVENMSGYVCPHCGEASDPFGSGGVERAAGRLDLPFLGRIPLSHSVRESSDAGDPVALGDTPEAQAFHAIARQIAVAEGLAKA